MSGVLVSSSSSSLLRGVFWKIVASFAFALISVLVRYLTKGEHSLGGLPVHQVVFMENTFAILLFTPYAFRRGKALFCPPEAFKHLLRVILASLGTLFWYASLKCMQIGYASALAFMGPIFTVIGGFFFLGERLTPLKNLAVFISLMGAFLIICPGFPFAGSGRGIFHETGFYALLPLLSAFCIAGAKIVTRHLAMKNKHLSSQTLTFYLMGGLFLTTLFPALSHWIPITLAHVWWCCVLGGLVGVAHYSTAQAFKYAGVNFLTPFSFLRLIAGIFLGYVLFKELPEYPTVWLGMGIILLSMILIRSPN